MKEIYFFPSFNPDSELIQLTFSEHLEHTIVPFCTMK